MRQLLVLTADDWTTLRRGGTIPFHIGNETYGLITEAGIAAVWNANNGTPPVEAVEAGVREQPAPVRRRSGKRYTLPEKRKIVAAMEMARERGEPIKDVLKRFGVADGSGSPYVWKREFDEQKKKKGD